MLQGYGGTIGLSFLVASHLAATYCKLAWYPAQRKSAWYTLMRFRLIKSGVLTFMTFTLFRGVFSDKIYVPTWPS